MHAAADEPAAVDYRPMARIGYLAIAVTFGGFGLWAASAPLDGAAVAQAKVAVESDRKPVQHLEGGIVQEIVAKEGQRVEEGQVLFRLQSIQAKANLEVLRKQLDAGLATEARFLAEQTGAPAIGFPADLLARAGGDRETALVIADEQRQFVERRRSLQAQVDVQKSRIDQTTQDNAAKQTRLKSMNSQLESYNTEIGRVSGLADKGYYPRNKLLALQRERDGMAGQVAGVHGEIALNKERLQEARLTIEQTLQQNRQQIAETLAQTRARNAEVREKLSTAADVLARIEVRAPRSGIVQGIKLSSVGAVVRGGDTLAEIIPVDDRLILSAKVSPSDINIVSAGQRAEVRFPAFSNKHMPPIRGKLERISADAVSDDKGGGQPYYSAKVVIDPASIAPEVAQSLVPGMPADVLIVTGERTMLQYLVGPMLDKLALGMREH
jgi:HlyD family secretion protein